VFGSHGLLPSKQVRRQIALARPEKDVAGDHRLRLPLDYTSDTLCRRMVHALNRVTARRQRGDFSSGYRAQIEREMDSVKKKWARFRNVIDPPTTAVTPMLGQNILVASDRINNNLRVRIDPGSLPGDNLTRKDPNFLR
jgi:hypothetical protein